MLSRFSSILNSSCIASIPSLPSRDLYESVSEYELGALVVTFERVLVAVIERFFKDYWVAEGTGGEGGSGLFLITFLGIFAKLLEWKRGYDIV